VVPRTQTTVLAFSAVELVLVIRANVTSSGRATFDNVSAIHPSAQLVLVVDDDEDLRGMYAEALELNGYEVLQAGNGRVAVEMAFVASLTAIVMDLDMPIMDGLSATHALKRDRRTAQTPVIVVTGSANGEELERARAAGCDVLLAKPCPPDVVVLAIEHVLRGEPYPDQLSRLPD
jgi:CheY-like chemotaxis protein